MIDIPKGFEPLFRTSPFLDLLGPIYSKRTDEGLVIGLRIVEKHCNARHFVHGGVLSSLADISLGYNVAFSGSNPLPIVTASLTIDFSGSVKLGEWIETKTEIQKTGRSLAFANCYFLTKGTCIARASAVFSVLKA
jgi:acyl-coenzyme A thioesterase 13